MLNYERSVSRTLFMDENSDRDHLNNSQYTIYIRDRKCLIKYSLTIYCILVVRLMSLSEVQGSR